MFINWVWFSVIIPTVSFVCFHLWVFLSIIAPSNSLEFLFFICQLIQLLMHFLEFIYTVYVVNMNNKCVILFFLNKCWIHHVMNGMVSFFHVVRVLCQTLYLFIYLLSYISKVAFLWRRVCPLFQLVTLT